MSRILVTGGSRSGKSAFAEELLQSEPVVDYVATGPKPTDDAEWVARLAAHVARRPATWRTIETQDVGAVLGVPGPAVLLDSLGTWVTAALDGVWWSGSIDSTALVDAWRATPRMVVAVTEEVGSGVVPATASGRRFRDELGALNVAMARAADEVWLVTVGIGQRLK